MSRQDQLPISHVEGSSHCHRSILIGVAFIGDGIGMIVFGQPLRTLGNGTGPPLAVAT